MEVCGDAEHRLASELMQYEMQIEKDVLDPLNQLAEVGPWSSQSSSALAFLLDQICAFFSVVFAFCLHGLIKTASVENGGCPVTVSWTWLNSMLLSHLQVDIPNIMKLRKQLARLVLDYDSARAR